MSSEPDRYAQAGVDYDALDRAKRAAIEAAASTTPFALGRGTAFLDASRGEPAAIFEMGGRHFAFVLECLGTKSMVARAYEELTGTDLYDRVGYDTVAAIVNDCCCAGALPFVVNAYFATASADFYTGTHATSLIAGWRRACADAGATWGGGESPSLSGLITEGEIDLAGSAVGLLPEGRLPLLGAEIRPGDEIVLVSSSGLHTNGASLVRQLATQLPDGLLTRLDSGITFGDAVLKESTIYVSLVEALFARGVALHYMTHLSGHGWRKLMRADREVSYHVTAVPPVPEVLGFLVDRLDMSSDEAYATFNMGAGFALYVDVDWGTRVVEIATELGYDTLVAGRVEEGPRSVRIDPHKLRYDGSELALR